MQSIFCLHFLSLLILSSENISNSDIQASGNEQTEFRTTIKEKKENNLGGTADTLKIKTEEIQKSARGSLLETISERSSDIYVTSSKTGFHGIASGASGSISVRGLGGSPNTQILVVEDGVPDVQGIFGHPIPDSYVPELISSAEVIKGGDSVRYGSNAMGAVIVLNPYFKQDDGNEFLFDIAYGSFSFSRNRLVLSGKERSLSYNLAFTYISSDGHRDFAGGNTNVFGTSAEYRFSERLTLRLFEKFTKLFGYDPGPASHPNINHFYDVKRNNLHIKADYKTGKIGVKIIPFFNFGEHRLYDGFHSYDYETGMIIESSLRFSNHIASCTGISAITSGGSVENIIKKVKPDIHSLSGYSFYNQTEAHLISSLNLQLGIREHYSPTYGNFFLYQAGILYRLYDDFYLRSRIARNFRQPTIRELYLPFPVANPGLKPEESLNKDISLGYNDKTFLTEITYYKTYAKNLIKYFGSWPTAEVVNIDEYDVPGIEASINLKNNYGMSLYVSFDKQDVGRYTKQNPSEKLNMGFFYRDKYNTDTYEFGISMEYVSGIFEKNYSRNPMKDIFFADFTSSYEMNFLKTPVQIYLIVRNLLNNRYEYILDYPMPGTNIIAGIRSHI